MLCQACKEWKTSNMRWVTDEVFARLLKSDKEMKSAVTQALSDPSGSAEQSRDYDVSDVRDAIRVGVKVKRHALALDAAEVQAVTGKQPKQLKLPTVNIPDEQGGKEKESVYVVADESKPFREIELYVCHETEMSSTILSNDMQTFPKQAAFALQHTVAKIQDDDNSKVLFGVLRGLKELKDTDPGSANPETKPCRSKAIASWSVVGEDGQAEGGGASLGAHPLSSASGAWGGPRTSPGRPSSSLSCPDALLGSPASVLARGRDCFQTPEGKSEFGRGEGSTIMGDDESDAAFLAEAAKAEMEGPMALAQSWIKKMPLTGILGGGKTGKAEYQAKLLIDKWSKAEPPANKVECGMLTSHLSMAAVCHALKSTKLGTLPMPTLKEYLEKVVAVNVRIPLKVQEALVSRFAAHIVSGGFPQTMERVQDFLAIIVPWCPACDADAIAPSTTFDPLLPKNSCVSGAGDQAKCDNFVNVVFKELVTTAMYEGEPKVMALLGFCKHSVDIFECEMSEDLERDAMSSTYSEALGALRGLIALLDEEVIDDTMLKDASDTISAGMHTGLQAARSIKTIVGNSLHNVPFYKAKAETFVKFESRTKKLSQRMDQLMSMLRNRDCVGQACMLETLGQVFDSLLEFALSFRPGFMKLLNDLTLQRIMECCSAVESATSGDELRSKDSLGTLLSLLDKAKVAYPLEDELVTRQDALNKLIRATTVASKANRIQEAAKRFIEASDIATGGDVVDDFFNVVEEAVGVVTSESAENIEAALGKMLATMRQDLQTQPPRLDRRKFQEMAAKMLSFVPPSTKECLAPQFDLVGKAMLLSALVVDLKSLGTDANMIGQADLGLEHCKEVVRSLDVVSKAVAACEANTQHTDPEANAAIDSVRQMAEKVVHDIGEALLLACQGDLGTHMEELSKVAGGGADGSSWSQGLRPGVDDKDWASFNKFCVETLAKADAGAIKAALDKVKGDLDRARFLCELFNLKEDASKMAEAVAMCKRARITCAEGVFMGLFNGKHEKMKLKTLCIKEKAAWLTCTGEVQTMQKMIADRLALALKCR